MYHFIIARRPEDQVLAAELIDGPLPDDLPNDAFANDVFDDPDMQILDVAPADFSAVMGGDGAAQRHAAVVLDALLNLDKIPDGDPLVHLAFARLYALGVNAGLRIAGTTCAPRWW